MKNAAARNQPNTRLLPINRQAAYSNNVAASMTRLEINQAKNQLESFNTSGMMALVIKLSNIRILQGTRCLVVNDLVKRSPFLRLYPAFSVFPHTGCNLEQYPERPEDSHGLQGHEKTRIIAVIEECLQHRTDPDGRGDHT
jgi:hypothetical protein